MSESKEPAAVDPELLAIAAAGDAELAGQAVMPGAVQEAAPGPNQADQIGGLLTMGVMMAAPALPFIPACYTPEVIGNISTAAAAVCEKHGWNIGDVMSPELVLAVAVLPPTLQAVVMFKHHQAEKRAALERAQRQQVQQGTDAPQTALLPQLPAPQPGPVH